jgi:hypothetical protein
MANEWLNTELRRVRGQLMSSVLAEEPPAVDDTAVDRLEQARDEPPEPRPKVDFSSGARTPIKPRPSASAQIHEIMLRRWGRIR